MKTQERQERLSRVQEIALRKGYAVATPPRGKYLYTLRSNRRGGATYLSGATLEAVERWLGTDEPPTPAPDFFRGKKYSTVRISDHLPPGCAGPFCHGGDVA